MKVKKYLNPSGSLTKRKRRSFYFTPEQEKLFNLVTVPGTNVNSNTTDARKTGVQALNFLAQEAARKDTEIEARSDRKTVKRLTTVGERLRGDNGYSSYMSGGTPMSGRDPALGTIFDWTVGAKGIDALGKTALWNYAKYVPTSGLGRWGRNYFINLAFNQQVKNSILEKQEVFPGLFGWAPKQTFEGYHASNEAEFVPNFFYRGWALRTHGAPSGIYIANGTRPSYGFLTERPYVHQVKTTFEKPMVLLGEVSGSTKNGIRNQIEEQARSMGADGIIYKDIADNQMLHLFIAKTLNPDTKVEQLYQGAKPYLQRNYSDPSKPNWYASNYMKRGESPTYYLVTVPKYWAEKQSAKFKIPERIEYEPEDYILEDGVNELVGLPYKGRPGQLSFLLQTFNNPEIKEPSTSLKFFERKPSKLNEDEKLGRPKGDRNNKKNINPDNVYGNLRFIRVIDGLPDMKNGLVQLGNPNKLLANFTTDLPFRLHSWYPNIPGPTYMVVSPRAFKGKKFYSIKPSDSFLSTVDSKVTPNQIRIISGDPKILAEAERRGMRTLTSDKLQDLFNTGSEITKKEFELGRNGAVRPFANADVAIDDFKFRNRFYGEDVPEILFKYPEGVVTPYRAEIDRLITQNIGRPSIKDYLVLENMTGLDAGITSKFDSEFIKKAKDPLANKDMFEKVYYPVTSQIEEELMNSIGLYSGPYYNFSNLLKLDKLKGNPLKKKQGGKITINNTDI